MFVAVEGPEGAGKSTVVRRLAKKLVAEGYRAVTVREPGGTPVAEALRRVVLNPRYDMPPTAELFLMLAARADLVHRVIQPALAAGRLVLADRFALSTVAYQVHGRGLAEADVLSANALATGGLWPDLTLVLDVEEQIGRERQTRRGRGRDRLEREEAGFHHRVRDAFRRARGADVVHLDGSRSRADVAAMAWEAIRAHVGGAPA